MIESKTHNKYISTIYVPCDIKEGHIVKALNEAIQNTAKNMGIDLGGALNWEVTVFQDYRFGENYGNSVREERVPGH